MLRARRGITLVEVIVATVLLGMAIVPIVSMQKQGLQTSRSNQRVHVAQGLAREALEMLFERRDDPAFGFAWIWANASPAAPGTAHLSGASNPSGTAVNPPLDVKHRGVPGDISSDTYDREVRMVRKQQVFNVNGVNQMVYFVEVRVTVSNLRESRLTSPSANSPPYFQLVTYIGNTPPNAI